MIDCGSSIPLNIRIPKEFSSNIRADSNKQMLNQTIREFYTTLIQLDTYKQGSNIYKLLNTNQNPLFVSALNRSIKDYFIQYKSSSSYANDVKKLLTKEGRSYVSHFKFYVDNFLDHFDVSN